MLGILNVIHIKEYNIYYESILKAILGEEGQLCRRQCKNNVMLNQNITPWLNLVSKISKNKPHILVVAPSNIAVDNIIERIMKDGFIDGNGISNIYIYILYYIHIYLKVSLLILSNFNYFSIFLSYSLSNFLCNYLSNSHYRWKV